MILTHCELLASQTRALPSSEPVKQHKTHQTSMSGSCDDCACCDADSAVSRYTSDALASASRWQTPGDLDGMAAMAEMVYIKGGAS